MSDVDQQPGAGNALFAAVILMAFWGIPMLVLTKPFLSDRQQRRVMMGPLCLASGHDWADEHRYGVEPVCLTCRKQREVSEA